MTPRFRRQPPSEWPFLILLAAWLSANIPQIAVFTVVTWMAEGRSFTHQERLNRDVARLLIGEKPTSPISDIVARAEKSGPTKTPLPADSAAKKIELSLETVSEVLPPKLRSRYSMVNAWNCPEARRTKPPLGPPRTSRM